MANKAKFNKTVNTMARAGKNGTTTIYKKTGGTPLRNDKSTKARSK